MCRSRRRAQRAVARREDAEVLVAEFKAARRSLKRAIERSKEECWKGFCATLDQDPWGRPHQVVKSRLVRSAPSEPLGGDRLASILDDLFVTGQQSRLGRQEIGLAPPAVTDEADDLQINEEDLKMAVGKCDPRKAAGVDGIPRTLIRLLAERRPRVLLAVLNGVNNCGRIPAVWKVARVMLIPTPNRDPALS